MRYSQRISTELRQRVTEAWGEPEKAAHAAMRELRTRYLPQVLPVDQGVAWAIRFGIAAAKCHALDAPVADQQEAYAQAVAALLSEANL